MLSTLVLISENRQSEMADRRARVDFEMNLIAEREITKLMEMVMEIQEHLGIQQHDPERHAMVQPTYVSRLAEVMEEIEEDGDAILDEARERAAGGDA